jgi:hypothetical protein
MAEIDALKLHQNVLIMQGIVASDALTILADLLHRVRMKSGKSTLQLWDIFSLICASGAAGCAMSLFLCRVVFAYHTQSISHTHRSRTADLGTVP